MMLRCDVDLMTIAFVLGIIMIGFILDSTLNSALIDDITTIADRLTT